MGGAEEEYLLKNKLAFSGMDGFSYVAHHLYGTFINLIPPPCFHSIVFTHSSIEQSKYIIYVQLNQFTMK